MYVLKEDQKKLITISLFIFLATVSLITGKTLANTIILTSYPTTILPYYYLSIALLTIIATLISSKYLQKSEQKFAFIFKGIVLFSLMIFFQVIKSGWFLAPFCISVLLLTYISIISLIAWNYASDIFDIQEFKQVSKILQVSATSGAIAAGSFVGFFSEKYGSSLLFGLIFLAELISIGCINPLEKYTIFSPPVTKKHLALTSTIKHNSMFKYLALMTLASVITATLIDYNLKLGFVADIEKQRIPHILSMIFVCSTTIILIFQIFLLDYLLHVFGSKKIIIIYPIAILAVALITLFHSSFIFMVVLFIVNEVFNYTTSSLSRNLYLNILPKAIKLLDRLKLNGTITPAAMICSSSLVFGITYLNHKVTVTLILIILISIGSLYLAKILMKQYRMQLVQSVYLRRFNPDLINLSPVDDHDIKYLFEQTLSYPDPEATLLGLHMLARFKTSALPQSLTSLLTGDNISIVRETARILSTHKEQRDYVQPAKSVFLKSEDDETKWYLALYLLEENLAPFIVDAALNNRRSSSTAIYCLVNLKQGNLEQQITAMQLLLKMFHSHDIEQMKWFLQVINEFAVLQKEEYLIQFINQDGRELQVLALRQINATASSDLLSSLVNHLGEPPIARELNSCFIRIGDRAIEPIENRYYVATTYALKMACIRTLSDLAGAKAELCLMNLLSSSQDVVIKTVIAKYVAYRGVKIKISSVLNCYLLHKIKEEVDYYLQLSAQLVHYKHPSIHEEVFSRLQFIKKRVLYYIAAIIGSVDILNSIPLLTSLRPDKSQQAIALELIDTTIEDRRIALFLMDLFIDKKIKNVGVTRLIDDPWLYQYIQNIESNTMDSIYMLTRLRKIDLFKNLAAETLQVLADCCSLRDMARGEVIFSEGDSGDGLYIIDSGEVTVIKQGVVIASLSESAYFGEMALLVDAPRFATIIASSDGVLFYIDKQDFDKITDEIPEIMKSINKQVIQYLTSDVQIGSQINGMSQRPSTLG